MALEPADLGDIKLNALITGGAGFIGSHLTEALIQSGCWVKVLDDFSTGSTENLSTVVDSAYLEIHKGTILNETLIADLVGTVDVIFHLAAAVGVERVIASPLSSMTVNIAGTELVLKMAARANKRVVLTSSIEVVGKSPQTIVSEDDDISFGPTRFTRWGYACSKAANEFMALAYHADLGLRVSAVRLTNTVGPRQTGNYGMVFPRFVGQALRGEPLTVFGTGMQARCFVHVKDIVEGLIACANYDDAAGQVFNLGSSEETTIQSLAERIIASTGSSSAIRHVPYEEAYGDGFDELPRAVPNLQKASRWFGYQPKRDLQTIISDVTKHFEKTQCTFA